MNGSCFVAGTDTGVGKTRCAAALLRAHVAAGRRAVGMKPVSAGGRTAIPPTLKRWYAHAPGNVHANEDVIELAIAGNVAAPLADMNPHDLAEPTSPHLAARAAGITIETGVIVAAWQRLAAAADVVVVEGAGGWLAPIGNASTMADVASALELPVVLVVGLRLGCLSHALLTRAAVLSTGLPFAGWIANSIEADFRQAGDYVEALTERLEGPPLAILPHAPGAAPLARIRPSN